MKTSAFIMFLAVLVSGIAVISCEPLTDTNLKKSGFRIAFSEGTILGGNEIMFYDSSAHLLFLKENLEFKQGATGFDVLVNNDTIYQGTIFPCYLSSRPLSQFVITDCFFYGKNVIEIGCSQETNDLRNDPRIINSLKESDLLHRGLSCSIDSIKVNSFDNYSAVVCSITIKNNDNISYYILDPVKMGELDFNCYTGGLNFQNINTKVSSFLRWSIPNSDWGNLTLNDFSILKGGAEVKYTFKSFDYYKMEKGIYKAQFRFCGLKYSIPDFNLSQKDGRIWVGVLNNTLDNITVE